VSTSHVQPTTVVKIGGSTLGGADTTLEDLALMQSRGLRPVVVHGGGKVISEWMERSGTVARFIRGLRVTDEATLQVVVAVLAGLVNKQLVATLQALGCPAVGLSGADGGLLQARVKDPELGYVGDVTGVDPAVVIQVMAMGAIPVVAPVAIAERPELGGSGGLLNVNGDSAAGALAAALEAGRLVFLTDVEGVMDGSRRVIPRLLPEQARALIESGVAGGGMIPKLEACLEALGHVHVTKIVDGREPHALLSSLNDSPSPGTVVG
jgi:acetylglutamate kinase